MIGGAKQRRGKRGGAGAKSGVLLNVGDVYHFIAGVDANGAALIGGAVEGELRVVHLDIEMAGLDKRDGDDIVIKRRISDLVVGDRPGNGRNGRTRRNRGTGQN